MMLRVEWKGLSSAAAGLYRGTVVGYVHTPSDTKAVIVQDPHVGTGGRRIMTAEDIRRLTPIGWRREIQIT